MNSLPKRKKAHLLPGSLFSSTIVRLEAALILDGGDTPPERGGAIGLVGRVTGKGVGWIMTLLETGVEGRIGMTLEGLNGGRAPGWLGPLKIEMVGASVKRREN